jgi:hypothetical protein
MNTKIVREHKGAVLVALLIGIIFLLPHLLMPILQDENQSYSPLVVKGVDARSVDEVLYAAYVQEVVEGHLIPRSNILEWKDQLILSHAGAPFPSLILGFISLFVGGVINTYILSYFLFTALSAILIYALAYLLTRNKTWSLLAAPLLFFSPTYVLKFFGDNITQPISYFSRFYPALVDFPIFAATLLAVFWLLKKRDWRYAVMSGILGGLLFYTYFYYWTFYIVFIGIICACCLIRKDFLLSKKIMVSGAITLGIGATFFLNSWQTVQNQAEILQRIGANFTRIPDWNITLFLLAIIAIVWFIGRKKEEKNNLFFLTALLLAGIIAMNVQVITGYTINPRHWLTTAIWPTLILAGVYVISSVEKWEEITKKVCYASIGVLLLFGLVWQVTYAQNTYSAYTLSDSKAALFDWLNQNTNQDEVVLSLRSEMILLLPVYTHNNNFIPNANVEPLPISELVGRRLVAYKILNVPEEKIIFLENPCAFEELLRNFEDEKDGVYDYTAFEEAFSHHLTFESYFTKKGCSVPAKFKAAVFKNYADLPEEVVHKYHLDYIIVSAEEKEIVEVPDYVQEVYKNEEFTVYEVK